LSIETGAKATVITEHDKAHTTNTSSGKNYIVLCSYSWCIAIDDGSTFPDDLELSFHNGKLDISKQLELSTTSTVPDIDDCNTHENTEPQEFYQLFTLSKSDVKSRKRTYRDFPNYTHKKPYPGSKQF